MKVLLVASSGGHLEQLWSLTEDWDWARRHWVSFDTPDAVARLAGEPVTWAHHPTNRHLGNLARNTRLAWTVLRRERPVVVVSNGAGVALPFLALARVMGLGTVYVEVVDRVERPALTTRLVAPWVHRLVWTDPRQEGMLPGGTYLGPLL